MSVNLPLTAAVAAVGPAAGGSLRRQQGIAAPQTT